MPIAWAEAAASTQMRWSGSRERWWESFIVRRVHGSRWHAAPQRGLRLPSSGGSADACFVLSSCSPWGISVRTGRSMPSAATAARPGGRATTFSLWSCWRFIVAPTARRSSSAGSRCMIFSALFLTTSGRILLGICSTMTTPSPYARISASSEANSSTAAAAGPSSVFFRSRCASSTTSTCRSGTPPLPWWTRRCSTRRMRTAPMRKALSWSFVIVSSSRTTLPESRPAMSSGWPPSKKRPGVPSRSEPMRTSTKPRTSAVTSLP